MNHYKQPTAATSRPPSQKYGSAYCHGCAVEGAGEAWYHTLHITHVYTTAGQWGHHKAHLPDSNASWG